MTGEERRKQILHLLAESGQPLSGGALAARLGVSRQVIVQDMALLRANNAGIFATNRGYVLQTAPQSAGVSRVLKVIHTDEEVEEELTLIVDMGGTVEDVFIYHKVYGVVRAELHLSSRRDIRRYMEEIRSGKSSYLKNATSGYHYHTVTARNEAELDAIQDALWKRGFLAKLQDYEPVKFGEGKE